MHEPIFRSMCAVSNVVVSCSSLPCYLPNAIIIIIIIIIIITICTIIIHVPLFPAV